jgi:hypothetical protein
VFGLGGTAWLPLATAYRHAGKLVSRNVSGLRRGGQQVPPAGPVTRRRVLVGTAETKTSAGVLNVDLTRQSCTHPNAANRTTVLRTAERCRWRDPNSSVNNLGETLAWTTGWRHDCETR